MIKKTYLITLKHALFLSIDMDKESRYELQKIDCNCNDCVFMDRDFDRFKASQEFHRKMQEDTFEADRKRLIARADEWKKKGEDEKHTYLMREVKKMRFVFDKSVCLINYGKCSKLGKDVSFIPNHCQLDTQECFEHRVDHLDEETKKQRLGL